MTDSHIHANTPIDWSTDGIIRRRNQFYAASQRAFWIRWNMGSLGGSAVGSAGALWAARGGADSSD